MNLYERTIYESDIGGIDGGVEDSSVTPSECDQLEDEIDQKAGRCKTRP